MRQLPSPSYGDYNAQNEAQFRREVESAIAELGNKISDTPVVSAIVGTFSYDGSAKITVTGNSFTKSIKCAVSAVAYPSTATVQAAIATNGQQADSSFAGPYAMGDTLYVSAMAYTGADGSGIASVKCDVLLKVTVIQSTLLVDVDQTSATGAAVTITVKITDPAGKLTGNADTTISFSGISSLYCNTLSQSVTTGQHLNLTIGSTYTFTATVNTNTVTGGYIKFSAIKTPGSYTGVSYWFGSGALAYLGCYAAVTSVSATQVTVQVTATSVSGSPTVQLVAVTGSCGLSSGASIGTPVASGSYWTFNRGSFQAGVGQVQFRAILSGFIQDDDFVDIPEVGRDTTYLASRARVTSSNATTVVVRYAVADPYPQGSNSATITYQDAGTGGVTPSSGGTVTPASTLTEGAGTYIDYTITRPSFTSGTGRVTFTATASGRVSDSDSVDIPAQEKTTFGPSLDVKVTPAATTYTLVVTYDGTMTYKIDGGTDNNGTGSPQTITVTRNDVGGAAIEYVFKCAKDSQTITNSVSVPAQMVGTPTLYVGPGFADTGAGTLLVSWTPTGMPTGTTYDIFYNNGGSYIGSYLGSSGTSHTFTGVTFNGSPGNGTITVVAQGPAGTVITKSNAGDYSF